MSYRLKHLAEGLYRVHRGRDAIGWVRGSGNTWHADAKGKKAQGDTPSQAFHELVRVMNNDFARREGFKDAREMVETRNREVEEHVRAVNAAAGMPILHTHRRRIRV